MTNQPDAKKELGDASSRVPLRSPLNKELEKNSSSPVPPIYNTDDSNSEE